MIKPLSNVATRLLLLASRPSVTDAQLAMLSSLSNGVEDWDVLASTAARKYSLPLVSQNLSRADCGAGAQEASDAMREASLNSIAATLRNHAAFSWFHSNCVRPVSAPYVYFKGPALAAAFYSLPVLRHFRDIDLLVDRHLALTYVKAAVDSGCRLWDPNEHRVLDPRVGDLVDYCRYCDTVSLLTPHNMLVELHQKLDPHLDLFDSKRLLADTKQVTIAGQCVETLRDEIHFVYICYHNTSHLWSKLSWLSDLAAMIATKSLDLEQVRRISSEVGLDETVRAAMAFNGLTAKGALPEDFPRPASLAAKGTQVTDLDAGLDLLAACIRILPGDNELEKSTREGMRSQRLPFSWQGNPRRSFHTLANKFKTRFSPNFFELREIAGGHEHRLTRHGVLLARRAMRASRRIINPSADV